MRFGRTFQKHLVPAEWMLAYVDYDALKKVLKTATALSQQNQQKGILIDLSDFECRLNNNINRVAEHYNIKREDCSTRLQFLKCCSAIDRGTGEPDADDNDDAYEALVELKHHYQLLSWFGDINRRALFRIIFKTEKKRLASTSQCQRWISRVSAKAFAFNGRLLEELRLVESSIVQLSANRTMKLPPISKNPNLPDITLGAPMISINSINETIEQDDVSALGTALRSLCEDNEAQGLIVHKALLAGLWHAVEHGSFTCMKFLLGRLDNFEDDESNGGRNIFHRAVIRVGQIRLERSSVKRCDSSHMVPAEPPLDIHGSSKTKADDGVDLKESNKQDEEPNFTTLLQAIKCHQVEALFLRDSHMRNTLHYAALYGLSDICQQLLEMLRACTAMGAASAVSDAEWQDLDGYTPFQLALIHGFAGSARAILQSSKVVTEDVKEMPQVVRICTMLNHIESLKLLLEVGADPTACDDNDESLFHLAARLGHHNCVLVLLEKSQAGDIIDHQDNLLRSTALIEACRSGHSRVVELLIHAGADVRTLDALGWTAKEHAAFRGYHDIVKCLEESGSKFERSDNFTKNALGLKAAHDQDPDEAEILSSRDLLAPSPSVSNPSSPVILPGSSSKGSKTGSGSFTTVSKSQNIIIVTLGTMNPSKALGAVTFDPIRTADAHVTQLDSTLSLVISASGADCAEPASFDLPVFDDARAEPIIFSTTDLTKVKLMFDIIPTVGSSKGRPIGRGVALLSNVGHQQSDSGLKKGNLQGDHCIALIGINSFDVIGSVNFNLRIVTPFSCPEMSPAIAYESKVSKWIEHKSTMIIGHRGLGKNMNAHKALQIGENTIQSFITAAKLGASFVEFDVQLTKDYVPVIYHDFLVGETGIDAPMHALTLEQFLYLNRGPNMHSSGSTTSHSQTSSTSEDESSQATSTTSPLVLPRPDPKAVQGQSSKLLTGPAMSIDRPGGKRIRRARSASMSMTSETSIGGAVADREERLKLTHSFKSRGFKANSKDFIQEPFTTLEEMFKKLPESIGFNIEMKYPMLWEAEAYNMDPYAIDLNTYVDTVLQIVFRLRSRHASSTTSQSSVREIVFSSFHPDLCLLLRLKQSQIPVLFLTDAGCNPEVGDVRATSLQEAVRFAARWNLLGIVSVVNPLIKCPRLVGVIKNWGKRGAGKGDGDGKGKGNKSQVEEKGLVCVSYGTGNNIPENAKLQADAGIDAVIVDHVLAVHRGLHGNASTAATDVTAG